MRPDDFMERLQAIYPKRPGNNWIVARTNIARCITHGVSWAEIEKGTRAYAEYVKSQGTEWKYIKPCQNFFDPRTMDFGADWSVPESVDPVRARTEARWEGLRGRAVACGFREPYSVESPDVYETQLRRAESEKAAPSREVGAISDLTQRFKRA